MRKSDYRKYKESKEKGADFLIEKGEKYLIPDLRKHMKVLDISTPATYAWYSGSPTGSIYDMSAYPDNFGRTRLKILTPIEGLYQPKFLHSGFACLLDVMQVNDMILDGKVMNGYARYKKRD